MYAEQQKRFFALMKRFGRLKMRERMKNLSQGEFMMLGAICHGTGMNHEFGTDKIHERRTQGILVSEVTDRMGGSKSATSKMLRTLEEKGYIERILGKKDKRHIYITLTEEGEKILATAQNEMDYFARKVIDRMGSRDIEALLELMEKLYGIMEEEIELLKRKEE